MKEAIARIVEQVESATGTRLPSAKALLLETRLRRRARALGIATLEGYVAHFESHRNVETQEVLSLLTTHTTSFFRDSEHFDFLLEQALPELLKLDRPIRLWSAACSTGEETYSLAITALERLRLSFGSARAKGLVEIAGTDVDSVSVERAQNGVYERKVLDPLNDALVARYFDLGTGDLSTMARVSDPVHELCTFSSMNLLAKPYPVRDADIVFLRNVLIYFSPDDVAQVLAEIQKSLRPGGLLFLGASESVDDMDPSYRKVSHSVYRFELDERSRRAEPSRKAQPKRVLIVDDSKAVRCALRALLREDQGFEVVGEAQDPIEARGLISELKPDVVTLDIHMPRQTGIEYLASISGMKHPPIVMVSSVGYEDADGAMRCFELGAFEYMEKPTRWDDAAFAEVFYETVRCAIKQQGMTAIPVGRSDPLGGLAQGKRDLILIGASTGGVEAVRRILQDIPKDAPPIVIVQHLPARFTTGFVQRLNTICGSPVHESEDGLAAERGHVYVAKGGFQTGVVPLDSRLRLVVKEDPPINRHRPSVDYLFESAAKMAPIWRISAALLTGMGNDGAKGLKSLRDAGAHTVAESEETAVVFGMPQEAIALGAAKEIVPLHEVLGSLFKPFRAQKNLAPAESLAQR